MYLPERRTEQEFSGPPSCRGLGAAAQRRMSGVVWHRDDTVDIQALLAIGAPLAKIEELYGKAAVLAVARQEVRKDPEESSSDGSRLLLASALLARSSSTREESLADPLFVRGLLSSLEEDPPDELMDPVMLCRLKDPVVLSSGHVLDRSTALDGNGALRLKTCPFSREWLKESVYPIVAVRKKLKAWKLERLGRCVEVSRTLAEKGLWADAEKAFDISEEFLDEVGDATSSFARGLFLLRARGVFDRSKVVERAVFDPAMPWPGTGVSRATSARSNSSRPSSRTRGASDVGGD